jgi:hypothetical protein
MSHNQLIMNVGKTEFTVLGRRTDVSKIDLSPTLSIGDETITATTTAIRDLGLILDPCLTMEDHVNASCRTSFSYLRAIAKQRNFLNRSNIELLVHSLVFSRLFYCSVILYGIGKKLESKMQRVINYAVRMIERIPKRESVKQHLLNRKWLNPRQRIRYAVAITVRTALKCPQPSQIASLLQHVPEASHATRRSLDSTLLKHHHAKTRLGNSAFSVAASAVWNSLPRSLRECEKRSVFCEDLRKHLLSSPA